jgi:hypothetical protein
MRTGMVWVLLWVNMAKINQHPRETLVKLADMLNHLNPGLNLKFFIVID